MTRYRWLLVPGLMGCSTATPGESATFGEGSIGDSGGADSGGSGDSGGATTSGGPPADTSGHGSSEESSSGDAPKFDLGVAPDFGTPGCEDSSGRAEFSHIWIANSNQGTVSKITTDTGEELARYATGPGVTEPSRTSVSLYGDVAVANRLEPGGVTRFAARLADCIDRNGNGTIDTSTSDDFLAWGDDECMLWHQPLGLQNYNFTPRAIAWSAGDPESSDAVCGVDANPPLWVGMGLDATNARVLRLDGATGEQLDEVVIPAWDVGEYNMGIYGGAVDPDGDFWVLPRGYGSVFEVDDQTLEITDHGNPGSHFYGVAIDSEGNVWTAGWDSSDLWVLDAIGSTWHSVGAIAGWGRGIAVSPEGSVWVAQNGLGNQCGIVQVDRATRTIVQQNIALPNCDWPVGVAVDAAGLIWAVDASANAAHRIDPSDLSVTTMSTNFLNPYTYSDMTGSGLAEVSRPPAG